MIQYHALNPFRPVNWRWERARLIREKQLRVRRPIDDLHVGEAYKFQMAFSKCKNDEAKWSLMEKYPIMYSAYMIHSAGSDSDRHPLRYAVEARILADQTDDQIADLIGTNPEVIATYERTFFNVREKLKNTDYIMTCVISSSIHSGLSDRDYDLLWKLYGYLYGGAMLDAFIHSTTNRLKPETPEEVNACLSDDAKNTIRRKAAIVSRTYTINPFSQTELLNIYARFVEIEKESDSGKSQDVILQNIAVMMNSIGWKTNEVNVVDRGELSKYDKYSGELKTNEILEISMGKAQSPEIAKEVEELKFPEQETK